MVEILFYHFLYVRIIIDTTCFTNTMRDRIQHIIAMNNVDAAATMDRGIEDEKHVYCYLLHIYYCNV